MAYSSWSVVFGEQPTAAKWNILGTNDASFNDGTGIAGLYKDLLTVDYNPYKFGAYRNAAWTTANGSAGKISFDTEEFDTNNDFASSKYTAPINGFYCFSFGFATSASVAGGAGIGLYLYKNGSACKSIFQGNTGAATYAVRLGGAAFVEATASDYFEVYCWTNGTAGGTGAVNTWFSGFLVSKT